MSVEIVTRTNLLAYSEDFKRINEAWISTNFWLEKSDVEVLNNPQKYILDKGGNVFIALLDGKPVGTLALIPYNALTCELAKMAVDPDSRGRGIGYQLGCVFIEKARERGFKRVILEGNTKMEASILLYRKLGFQEVPYNVNAVHSRCNIFMELKLNPDSLPEYYI